jgi:uncharacterized protein (DUF983 family)
MSTHVLTEEDDRPMSLSLRRGWSCRCPKCGQGRLLHAYLKVNDSCAVCGESYVHQRADDGPAYLTILIVGHLLAPLIYYVFVEYRPSPVVLASIFTTLTVTLALFLLPRLKGMLVALQWSRRMHGFGHVSDEPAHD